MHFSSLCFHEPLWNPSAACAIWLIEFKYPAWLLLQSARDVLIVIPHSGWLHAAIEENPIHFCFYLSFFLWFSSALVVRLLTNRFIWEYDPTLGKNTITLRALVLRRLSRACCLFEPLRRAVCTWRRSRGFGVPLSKPKFRFSCVNCDPFMPTLSFTF